MWPWPAMLSSRLGSGSYSSSSRRTALPRRSLSGCRAKRRLDGAVRDRASPDVLGALIMLFGVPLALGAWWGFLTIIPMALVIVWRLSTRNAFLRGASRDTRSIAKRSGIAWCRSFGDGWLGRQYARMAAGTLSLTLRGPSMILRRDQARERPPSRLREACAGLPAKAGLLREIRDVRCHQDRRQAVPRGGRRGRDRSRRSQATPARRWSSPRC